MTLRLNPLRWLLTLLGVQFLCAVAWVLGPLLPPLDPWPARAAVVMALLLLWAALNLLADGRTSRRDAALAHGVAGANEASALGAKLAAALAAIRKARGRLTDQPWYVIIGPPGAGKTTALLNANLTFPLATDQTAIAGVGGTRLCEWWFTNEAVLIDTAGRYTTHDSDAQTDRAGWLAFLDLLRRTRPKQPLNGVIVAIALSDVASPTDPALQHAHAVRARLDELQSRLGLRLPIYVLFTKADLLAGFTEFFDDLDRPARAQIWGATLPRHGRPDIAAALRPLQDRLNRRVFQRLDAEPGAERRALIAAFPAQFASVLPPIQSFLAAAFAPAPNDEAPMLRGLYLTSATQEGAPIDRLLGALSRSFGLDASRARTARPGAARSFFLEGILRDVVFREASLVAHRPGAARRRTLLRAAGFTACAALATLGVGAVLLEAARHDDAITRAQAAITRQQALAAELPLDPVADSNLAALLPWLDAATPPAAAPPPDVLGLAQTDKLAAAARAQYRHALDFALLPRLVWRVETQMRGLLDQPEPLYEATRIYLMLGGAGPLDRALLTDWFTRDWAATLPGDAATPSRDHLARHLAALLSEPPPPVPLDGPLVAAARRVIGRVPLATRAWSRLKPLVAARALPPWRPADALGPAGVRLFLRLSGRGLEDGIPALYTIEGARAAVLPALPKAAEDAAAEGWVLGEPIDPDSPRRRSLEADMLALYATEYIAAWDALLADLDPAPMRNLAQAAQDLYILSSAQHSPIRSLLAGVTRDVAPAAATGAAGLAPVDQKFQTLRAIFGTGGAAPIDLVLRPLYALQQQLAKQAATTVRAAAGAGEDPAAALRAEAVRQPEPLARWLTSLANGGAALRDGGPRGAMIAAWNAGGGPAALCPAVIANKYPFATTAAADASVEDFTRLLGPGGALDAFFNAQLRPFVDVTAKPWKLQPVDGVNAPLTPSDLAQFQRAAEIRDLFFPAGSAQPLVRFDITPGPLDPAASSATLDLGAATVTTTRGSPGRPAAITWPGRTRTTAARLVVNAPPPATPLTLEAEGPWAMFRLLATAKAAPAGDRTLLTFAGNDRTARFDLRATPNPFTTPLLQQFRCPAVQ